MSGGIPEISLQPLVTSVSPLSAKQGETVTFTVTGNNLPQTLNFSVADCAPAQTVARETCTATQCQFTCTPSATGCKAGTVKNADGTVLYNFTIAVQASQCAVYNPAATPQVTLPCVQVNGAPFQAGMNLVPGAGLRFEVDMAHTGPVSLTPGEACAAFPHEGMAGRLRLNCIEVGGKRLWVNLNQVREPGGTEYALTWRISGRDNRINAPPDG